MTAFIIASMCVINLLLWLVFFIKFKKLFTTDNEIQKARDQYELLINDINRNTLNNINLIEDKIQEMNDLVQIVDRRLAAIQNDESFITSKQGLAAQRPLKPASKSASSKKASAAKTVIDQDAAFEVNINLKKSRKKLQADLFEEEKPVSKKTKDRSVHVVDTQGNAYGEVPVISPKIYMSDNPIAAKKTFQDEVKKMYNAGYTVEQISRELNKSTTEVQFIIDML